ncbi:hypothetical protein SLA2020_147680 [Shorea laevis]
MVKELEEIQVVGGKDSITWLLTASVEFSIASSYKLLRLRKRKVSWHKLVWSGSAIPRHAFISWLMVRDRLKSKTLLCQVGIVVDTSCVIVSRIANIYFLSVLFERQSGLQFRWSWVLHVPPFSRVTSGCG